MSLLPSFSLTPGQGYENKQLRGQIKYFKDVLERKAFSLDKEWMTMAFPSQDISLDTCYEKMVNPLEVKRAVM